MRKHSQRKQSSQQSKKAPKGKLAEARTASKEVFGFTAAFEQMLQGSSLPTVGKRRGKPPRVSLKSLLSALVFHFMHSAGTLAEHFDMLFEDSLCDSACSDRRARLPWEVFAQLMQRALRPLAHKGRHPESFWRGWRLIAMDATQWSLTNTPQNNEQMDKAQSRRGKAAFAKIVTGVLLEVGLHNPLAAAIGHHGQSEWKLALSLLAQIPKKALLLADRLHGCAAFVVEALAACQPVGSHFLIRARSQIKVQTVRKLKDGSRLIRVPVRQKGKPRVIVQWLELREIKVRVGRPGFKSQELRLWTSLLDPKSAPAGELAELYARRWEHELYYRELKHALRKGEVLLSHTVMTAAQEIAAIVLASALLAKERARAAAGEVPVLRLSFVKMLELMRPLWLVFELGADLLSQEQKEALVKRFYEQAQRMISRPRRSRSCPRAVRQPVSSWPRLVKNKSLEGPLRFTIF
jgi:Transposase DDE domain